MKLVTSKFLHELFISVGREDVEPIIRMMASTTDVGSQCISFCSECKLELFTLASTPDVFDDVSAQVNILLAGSLLNYYVLIALPNSQLSWHVLDIITREDVTCTLICTHFSQHFIRHFQIYFVE